MSKVAWSPRATREVLLLRARMRDQIRAHFSANALEIDVPVCQGGPNRDHGVQVASIAQPQRWLTTSPEHPLKRLVAAGYGAVWSLSPCVRLGESGRLHRPEFTMLEWYRPGWSLAALQDECIQLLALLLDRKLSVQEISWSRAMAMVLGVSPCAVDDEALHRCAPELPADCSRSDCLDYIFATQVQPQLGKNCCTVVNQWPAAACAQAKVLPAADGNNYAARFELFIDGVELANAYDECWDAAEMRRRFSADAQHRAETNPQHDEAYLASLAHDPGPVCGVAMGFDRIILLAAGLSDIGDGMAFPWEIA